jgi:hypothetical protein
MKLLNEATLRQRELRVGSRMLKRCPLCHTEKDELILNKLSMYNRILFSVTLQPKSGLGCLVLRFLDHAHLDTHTHTHTHALALLQTSDQPVAQAATYTRQ